MARRLSYSFYTKDWQTNDKVMFLTLEQRGFYRELIDLAMMNDNKVEYNLKVFCRKFSITSTKCTKLLNHLIDKKLIEISNDFITVPSCERRLSAKRNGSEGGKATALNSTPNGTPKSTPNMNLNLNKNLNINNKEKEDLFALFSSLYLKKDKMQIAKDIFLGLDLETCKLIIDVLPRYNYSKIDIETKFLPRATDWLNDKEYLTEYDKTPLEIAWNKYNEPEANISEKELIRIWNTTGGKRVGDQFTGDLYSHRVEKDYNLINSFPYKYTRNEVEKTVRHYLRDRDNTKIENLVENFDMFLDELDLKPKMTKEEYAEKYNKYNPTF